MSGSVVPTLLLLDIVGGVCLLLWGLRMVRHGIMRAFGVKLRQAISFGTRNRFMAFGAGILVTAILQSSTATTMIISGLAGQGLMPAASAIAVVLGADVGTTLVAQAFSLNLSWLGPSLFILGTALYSMYERSGRMEHIGAVMIGLGIMMFALGWIGRAEIPLKESEVLPLILGPLQNDHVLAVFVGALMTWLAHSSLAIVLLVISLAIPGVLPLDLCLVLVLGTNLGNAVAPLIAGIRDNPVAARVALGNLLMRFVTVCLLLPWVGVILPLISSIEPEAARVIVNFHTAFNLFLALLFLPITPIVARVAAEIIPEKKDEHDPSVPVYLHEKDIETPRVALTAIARESLRMADIAERMLRESLRAFSANDENLILRIQAEDSVIDKIYREIKGYMVRLNQAEMDPEDADRFLHILSFATNIEYVGDVIDKSLMPMAQKKIRAHMTFSDQGFAEIRNMYGLVLESMRMSQTVFMSGDAKLARELVEGKDTIRKVEKQAIANHIIRLREAVPESVATSSLHMDIVRDLRRINTYLVTVAYPILEGGGHLHTSRLKPERPRNGKPHRKQDIMSDPEAEILPEGALDVPTEDTAPILPETA